MHLAVKQSELITRLADVAKGVFAGTDVFLAYAFGSRIVGRPRCNSDLDVGYYVSGRPGSSALSVRQEMTLACRLSAQLGVDVDLHDLGQASLEFRGRVLEDGVRIYCADPVARVNLERDLLGRYHDYKAELLHMHDVRLRRRALTGSRVIHGR